MVKEYFRRPISTILNALGAKLSRYIYLRFQHLHGAEFVTSDTFEQKLRVKETATSVLTAVYLFLQSLA